MDRKDAMERIRSLALAEEDRIVALRRRMHERPEVSWEEVRTTDLIEEELRAMGATVVRRGFGGTGSGIVAEIAGARPGKRVALRADIDALPVREENDVPYRSQVEGVMHACGHDAHAAMLLGAARMLREMEGELRGTVRLLFQPAEESALHSGAKAMLDEGALDGVDAVFGLHVSSDYPAGVVECAPGPIMAACDRWDIVIEGKGGHGSAPEGAIDPTVAAFHIGSALHEITSREVSPMETAVLSVGGIVTSSNVFNVIPERVTMTGTVRTFRPEVQDTIQRAVERVASMTAKACRCEARTEYTRQIPATVNDPALTELLMDVARDLLGPDATIEARPIMGSEDFSYICEALPATYAFLGTASGPATSAPHHSARFDVDEAQLWRGAALYTAFAWRALMG